MVQIVVDVETTGLGHVAYPPRDDGVVQVGMAWRANRKVNSWSSYCNPGNSLLDCGRADAALSINRIPLEVIHNARPVKSVAKDFWSKVKAIEKVTGGQAEFLAYNRGFDEGFLSKSPWLVQSHQWGPCVMKSAAIHLTGYSRLSLTRAMQLLEIPWPAKGAHDAAVDAHAALLVHERIAGKLGRR